MSHVPQRFSCDLATNINILYDHLYQESQIEHNTSYLYDDIILLLIKKNHQVYLISCKKYIVAISFKNEIGALFLREKLPRK